MFLRVLRTSLSPSEHRNKFSSDCLRKLRNITEKCVARFRTLSRGFRHKEHQFPFGTQFCYLRETLRLVVFRNATSLCATKCTKIQITLKVSISKFKQQNKQSLRSFLSQVANSVKLALASKYAISVAKCGNTDLENWTCKVIWKRIILHKRYKEYISFKRESNLNMHITCASLNDGFPSGCTDNPSLTWCYIHVTSGVQVAALGPCSCHPQIQRRFCFSNLWSVLILSLIVIFIVKTRYCLIWNKSRLNTVRKWRNVPLAMRLSNILSKCLRHTFCCFVLFIYIYIISISSLIFQPRFWLILIFMSISNWEFRFNIP